MSERLPLNPERHSSSHEELEKKKHELAKDTIEKGRHARHEHAEKVDDIRAKIEQESRKAEEATRLQEKTPSNPEQPVFVNRELKDMAYRRTLKRARSQLPAPSRALSKFVHQPSVEALSEAAGKTIARPSGILAGGIAALIGSSVFLWIARHYGYEYNFLLFALFFLAGFFVGLLIELVVRLVRNRKP